jgi:site-specific recombinase XerD
MVAFATGEFFEHTDSFFDYRTTVYEVSEETRRSNRIDLNLFKNYLEENQLVHIDGPAVIGFQYELKQNRQNSSASINRKMFTLRSYSNFLKLNQLEGADSLPFGYVPKVRCGYVNRPGFLTPEQLKQLFDSIERSSCIAIRNYAIYALMYGLGLRVGEVHHLKLGDLDLDRQQLTVQGKGGKQRTLYLTGELTNILGEWLAVRETFYRSKEIDALFISKKGNPIAIRTMEDNFKKIVEKAELETPFNVTCHTLRHSFATHLNEKNVDILVLQSLLGHSNPRSTQIYIHATEEKVRQALERLPAIQFMNQLIASGKLKLKFQPDYQKGAGQRSRLVAE